MKTKTGFILLSLILLFFITCRKDKENPTVGNKIELGVNLIDTVSYFFTGIQTEVISLGGNEIIQHGHCWNKESNPTIEGNRTQLGKLTAIIDFQSVIDSLEPNTVYHIRPYIQTTYAVAYGEEEQIKTLKTGKPVVLTNPVSDITLTSALSGGTVTRDSGLVVTARGVCWDTTAVFRIDSCIGFTVDSLGLGSFSSDVTGLHEGTNYRLAAYATNENGTSYGPVRIFSTIPLILPVVVTSNIINITASSAQCGGNVIEDGNGTVTLRGVCFDTVSTPTFEDNLGHTENGSGTGEFTSNITNLDEEKTYYVVAYATNEKGTGYGEIKSFTTSQLTVPSVTTTIITNITTNSAVSGGNVLNNGGGTVAARGVCWNSTGDPTLQNCIDSTSNGSGLGSFTSNITGLTTNTTFYVRAYAKNEEGIGYGNQIIFTTLSIPIVSTNSVINITSTTANSGGNVTDDGGAPVNARGVCWSTSQNPTISNSHTTNGSGTGSFVSIITGLNPNTTYYLRAYATNSAGTGYGTQKYFTTTLHSIGDTYEGGIIFYLDGSGGGLVCAPYDQSISSWGCEGTTIGSTSVSIGTGASNTLYIVSECPESGIAARSCYDEVLNGYNDWFLPSKDELNLMYVNLKQAGIGGFENDEYWSSSEFSSTYAWKQDFDNSNQNFDNKGDYKYVRAARAFSY